MVLVVLLVSPAGSGAIWSGKKEPATSGEAAREYAKGAVRNVADAASDAGERFVVVWTFQLCGFFRV
jgi:hypothetical protein